MTEGTIWKSIVAFAIPLFLGNLFQQLYNMADSLIVGNFLGSNALAAPNSNAFSFEQRSSVTHLKLYFMNLLLSMLFLIFFNYLFCITGMLYFPALFSIE